MTLTLMVLYCVEGISIHDLKIENLITNVGLDAMVDFPAINNAILDDCLTNRVDLFTKPYPLHANANKN
jgi:hypothetical protein